ncbi:MULTISPECIES: TadE/TadG family type IV pilus assembly protein [Erythrobacter]|uniref:TadE/TadG family type IV pilus assembly protein n=1 Tax=Erythrobacter TaxID=1041 RepID=UPI001F2BAFDD|nr:TadE/TadG family type IV pilus assembly protein [Erythrobacter sp. SN021]MCF8881738.1 pilus assembly protein [Erythrobacter sp. SN021]
MRLPPVIRRLRRDQRGATIIEFAIISGPMLLLLMGGLELGYDSYVRSTMQGALNDAARTAAVEFPIINVPGSTVEEQVENLIEEQVHNVAPNATITVTQKSYFDFSSIGDPEKLMTDNNGNGQFDAADGDCYEDANGNGSYDTDAGKTGNGGADDVVLYTAHVSAPRILPLDGFLPGVGPTIEYSLQTAVRNQPYDQQATAAVICA